jgi:16S rRNA (adenine1518-N6/adenine1519-N6)-dimethyltransferase
VHVVEVDTRLQTRLREALAPFANVTLHFADALELPLAELDPAPDKVVANLPYSIAATVLLRTIEELPGVRSWVVMVQREVGERLAAAPGSSAYGVTSVLAQLACEVKVLRPVGRMVFRPVPNVDSVLVGLRRVGPAATPEVRALVRDAFAHRRKALPRSLALARAGASGAPDVRERAREALQAMGHSPDVRAERLAPQEFVALARRLEP